MSNPVKGLEIKGKNKTYINYRLKKKVYLFLYNIIICFMNLIII
jgi:hypothetical protein